MTILLDLVKIDLTLALLFFLPGYSVLIALMRNKNPLGILGTLLISMVLSLGIVNFALIFIDKIGLELLPANIIFTVLFISAVAFLFYAILPEKKIKKNSDKNNWLLFLLVVLFSVFLRITFLLPKAIPHTTDLGHHMYWVNYIIQFHKLPIYGIPDVIIGEHLFFGSVSILSEIGIFTALPMALLFAINILSLLAMFLLTKEIADLIFKKESGFFIGIISLISIGIFYSIASPQATYINGGVIGNIMGNLFIPIIFYLFIKAFHEKTPTLAALGIFLIGNLAYTHHLSSFIFIYSLVGFLILLFAGFLILRFFFRQTDFSLFPFFKIFINLKTVLAIALVLIWVLFLRLPSYLNSSAIDTAVGSPSKSTRVGLSINNLINSTGPWRVFYSLIGIIFLLVLFYQFTKNKIDFQKKYQTQKPRPLEMLVATSLSISWFATIFLMSYRPDLLKIDIISGRIANYLTYPSALLAAFGVYAVLQPFATKKNNFVYLLIFSVVFIPGVISGLFDVSENYSESKELIETEDTVQTFRASSYLNEETSWESDRILKDHIYLTGDTWIKNFLMRDYEEPLSRTYSRKYDDSVNSRETCTRDMIGLPDEEVSRKCFQETGVNFIVLKNGFDTIQFEKSTNFSKIFTTGKTVIFKRNYE